MKNNKIIIISFLTIIFGVLATYPITFLMISNNKLVLQYDNFKIHHNKNYKIMKNLRNKIDKTKLSIENRANNYFPFYSSINNGLSDLYLNINKPLYKALNYEYMPIPSTSFNEYCYLNDNLLFYQTALNNEQLDIRYKDQVNFINNLYRDGINMYVYFPNRLEFSNKNQESLKIRNIGKYLGYFKLDVNPKIKVETLKYDSDNYYKTDHHWNAYGASLGYIEIANMMGENPLIPKINTYNIDYMGSLSKKAKIKNIKDKFYGIDVDLNYNVLVNDKKPDDKFKPKKIIKSKNPYYDYYVSYFNGQYGKIEYDFNNPYKENLLILGDSFVWQIDELLASHFNKTYVVNIRYLEKEFNYDKFIKDNNIKNVLILNETQTTLFDLYNDNMKGMVKWNSQA